MSNIVEQMCQAAELEPYREGQAEFDELVVQVLIEELEEETSRAD